MSGNLFFMRYSRLANNESDANIFSRFKLVIDHLLLSIGFLKNKHNRGILPFSLTRFFISRQFNANRFCRVLVKIMAELHLSFFFYKNSKIKNFRKCVIITQHGHYFHPVYTAA